MRPGFGWTWFPGARAGHYCYHPAMVGFFGFGGAGIGVGFGFGNVGWVALAPFERFHPWYGPGWFAGGALAGGRLGLANRVVPNANIMTAFRNARVGNGVVAVSAQDFQRGAFRNQIAVNRAQLLQGSLVHGAVPITPTANNLRFSDRPVSAAAIPRNEAGSQQRFFSRMPAASTQRTAFAQQQAAVRSAFGGGAAGSGAAGGRQTAERAGGDAQGRGGQSQTAGSGWRRFGEPSAAQPRNNQSAGSAGSNSAGWDRFGSPQRSAAPQQERSNLPPVIYGSGNGSANAYRGSSGQSRALQVAPPIVQQRAAPAPRAPSYSAPPTSRGGSGNSGGSRSSGGHSGGRR
jgi:hypothetical protein